MKNILRLTLLLITSQCSAQSPVLVKDILQAYSETTYPVGLYGYNNKVYFNAFENVTGGWEPWISNGTNTGTNLIKDIQFGGGGSGPHDFTGSNGLVYFVADDGINGQELWVTDGTDPGTHMVQDINPGSANSMTSLKGIAYSNRLIFAADDGIHGEEIWITDGTIAGTSMLKDINTANNLGSDPGFFCIANGTAYFSAYSVNGSTPTVEIWRTDGSSAGTIMTHSFPSGSMWDMTAAGNKLYFVINDIIGGTLYGSHPRTSDGNSIIVLANNIRADKFTTVGDNVFFTATGMTSYFDKELYISDGTAAGTHIVKDIIPGTADGGDPKNFTAWGNRLVFSAEDGIHGRELWISDGTNAGTYMVQDIYQGPQTGMSQYSANPIIYHNKIYFSATNDLFRNLYVSDGTDIGTSPINYDPLAFGIARIKEYPSFTLADSSLYFVANYDQVGLELYKLNTDCSVPQSNFTVTQLNNTVEFAYAGNGYDSLSWDFGNGTTSTLVNPSHTFMMNGVFNVCLTLYNSCGSDTHCETVSITTNTTSAADIQLKNDLLIYPNPANEYFTIEGAANTVLTIYDITGKQLMQKNIEGSKEAISVNTISAGTYYLKVGSMIKKITIIR